MGSEFSSTDEQIKCVEDEKDASNPCIGCRNIQIDCTYDYVKKKPGRKNSCVEV